MQRVIQPNQKLLTRGLVGRFAWSMITQTLAIKHHVRTIHHVLKKIYEKLSQKIPFIPT